MTTVKLTRGEFEITIKNADLGFDHAYATLKWGAGDGNYLFLAGSEIEELMLLAREASYQVSDPGFPAPDADSLEIVPDDDENPLVEMLAEIRDQARSELPSDSFPHNDLSTFRADRLAQIARKADQALADHELRKQAE